MPVNSIRIADDHTDKTLATDVLIGSTRIALRVRKPDQISYANQFTLRTTKTYGSCEWEKIKRGYVRYMLYGFADHHTGLQFWHLIDLRKLRRVDGVERHYDGGSFLAFRLADCRAAIVANGGAVAAPKAVERKPLALRPIKRTRAILSEERQLWADAIDEWDRFYKAAGAAA